MDRAQGALETILLVGGAIIMATTLAYLIKETFKNENILNILERGV